MINLKIDPEFQSQIPPLTDDEFKQLEENILKEGKLNTRRFIFPPCRSPLKAGKKFSLGSAKTSWGGAI